MTTCIALLRGVNVAGHNKLPMAGLRALLAELGYSGIRTYIQSGNAVFETDDPAAAERRIGEGIEAHFGFRPPVLVWSAEEFVEAVDANPYPDATAEPKSLHLFFLTGTPVAAAFKAMNQLKADSEHYTLDGQVLYLHAPDGIGRSKLASNVENLLGVPVTARNWRTVSKLCEMAREN